MALMPLLQALSRVFFKSWVVTVRSTGPIGRIFEHHVHPLRRNGQRRVNGRSVRVDQFGPLFAPEPQCATTVATKVPFCRARRHVSICIIHPGVVDADMLLARNLQAFGFAPQIDGKPTASGRFSAYATVALQERARGLARQ